MAITYNWNFDPLEVRYSSASLTNVVKIIHWQFHGTTEATSSFGVSGSFQSSNIGTVNLDTVASDDFVAYDSLTEAVVEGWVTGSLGDDRVADISASVSRSLESQINPSTGTNLDRPW